MDLPTFLYWGWLADALLLGWIVLSWSRGWKAIGASGALPLKYALPAAAGMLAGLSVLLIATPFVYYISYSADLRPSKGWRAAMDCASFTLPCLAGVAAGFALVGSANRGRDFRNDSNARYYIVSAVILAIAYLCYLARHYRPLVNQSVGIATIYASVTALALLLYVRYLPESVEDVDGDAAKPLSPDPVVEDTANDAPQRNEGEEGEEGAAPAPSLGTEPPSDPSSLTTAAGAATDEGQAKFERLRGQAQAGMWILAILVISQVLLTVIYANTGTDLVMMRAYHDEE
ncbi:hypothetical protein [Dyella sp. 333MFSha]|uniref:hypothetical protein n=1 Tax=Dyella sp. 333MFSha TaxID=1798240 RepID=UPI00088407C8|nr:hypothetical protein [Dyella sp. 333MFSha]SDF27128.1 hypothetical protein SAMN04515659_0555 [Dyella sp. 333MFSha]